MSLNSTHCHATMRISAQTQIRASVREAYDRVAICDLGTCSDGEILRQGMHMNIFSRVYCDRVCFLCTKRIATGSGFRPPAATPPPSTWKSSALPPPPPPPPRASRSHQLVLLRLTACSLALARLLFVLLRASSLYSVPARIHWVLYSYPLEGDLTLRLLAIV